MGARSSFQGAAPAHDATLLTTSDTLDLTVEARALYIGGAGDVRVLTREGSDTVFSAVPAGSILPVFTKRVFATNTTATLIVALI